jgi:hypothetical protein
MNNPPSSKRVCPVCGKSFEMFYGKQVDPDNPVCYRCWQERERLKANPGMQFDGDWADPTDPAFWQRHDMREFIDRVIRPFVEYFRR